MGKRNFFLWSFVAAQCEHSIGFSVNPSGSGLAVTFTHYKLTLPADHWRIQNHSTEHFSFTLPARRTSVKLPIHTSNFLCFFVARCEQQIELSKNQPGSDIDFAFAFAQCKWTLKYTYRNVQCLETALENSINVVGNLYSTLYTYHIIAVRTFTVNLTKTTSLDPYRTDPLHCKATCL